MAPPASRKTTPAAAAAATETKEEAKKRRAVQAEKRRLAAERAAEDRAKRTRKRKAVDDDEEEKAEDIKSPLKRTRVARPTKTSSTAVAAAAKKRPAAAAAKKPDPEPEETEEEEEKDQVEEEKEEEEPEEKEDAKPASLPTSSRTAKRVASKSVNRHTPTVARVARKTQTTKHARPTSRAAAATPPRRAVSGAAAGKAPFGSPTPALKKASRAKPQDPPQATAAPAPAAVAAPAPRRATAPAPPVAAPVPAPAPVIQRPPPREPPANPSTATTNTSSSSNNNEIPVPGRHREPVEERREEINVEDDDDDDEFDDDDDYDDYDDDDDDDEDDEDHNSLRQQALRVIAERRDREYVARMQAQAAAIAREQRQMEQERKDAENKRKKVTRPLSYMAIMVFLTWWMVRTFPNGLNWMELLFPHLLPKKHVCFESSTAIRMDENGEELPPVPIVPRCQAKPVDYVDEDGRTVSIQWKACPTGATCEGGDLLECPRLYAIHHDYCYLSSKSNETLQQLQDFLHEWSVCAYCNGRHEEANNDVAPWVGRPFFKYSVVVGELECDYDPSLLILGNQTITKKGVEVPLFVLEQEDSDMWVALHPQVPLVISYTCRIVRFVIFTVFILTTLLAMAATIIGDVIQQCSILYYSAFMESPVYVGSGTVIFLLVSVAARARWMENRKREQRDLEILAVRADVHERLEDQSSEGRALSVEWLAQDISWKRHEMSKQGRKNLLKHVWPKVVGDIMEDGRIQKVVRTEQGKRMEYWKWVAPSSMPVSASAPYGSRERMVRFDQ